MRKAQGMRDSQVTETGGNDASELIDGDASQTFDESAGEETGGDNQLSELQHELTAERDKHLRLVAEFDNFRKRMMKERSEAESRGQMELAKQIIDSLDDIARFAHVDPATTDSTTLVQGVEMVEKKLGKSLRTAGLESVNPVGEAFDPNLHEAVATEPATSADEDHTVARVYQVGYTF